MNDSIFVDTNILVYSYEKSDDLRCQVSKDIVLAGFRGEKNVCVSNQVLGEFFNVITTKGEHVLSAQEARTLLLLIDESPPWRKVNYTTRTVITASELSHRHGLPIWDALIAATMMENDISIMYTENVKDFSKIPRITAINPFKKSSEEKISPAKDSS